MHECKITFKAAMPDAIKEEVKFYLNQNKWLIPVWLQELYIFYQEDTSEEDKSWCLSVSVDSAYRFASITVYPRWYGRTEYYKSEDFFHEFLHLHINNISDYAVEKFEMLLTDSPLFLKTIKEHIHKETEKAITDLSYLINKKMLE